MQEFKVVIELKDEPTMSFTLRTYSGESSQELVAYYKTRYFMYTRVKVTLSS